MGGYDKEPDYGGPPVRGWEFPLFAVAVIIASLVFLWLVL